MASLQHSDRQARRGLTLAARGLRNPRTALLAVRVYVLLIVARGVITAIPMRRLTRHLGVAGEETPRDGLTEGQLLQARRIGLMILRLAPFTPTNSNCYPQALVARWLLSRRGIPTTYYYGARFDVDGTSLDAHVWLRCGNLIVTGGLVAPHKPLTSYANNPGQRYGRRGRDASADRVKGPARSTRWPRSAHD